MSNNDANINKINWFPGHMKKATDEIIKKIKDVDFIIEVIDARGIEVTSNQELINIVKNKPILKVALKSDLSDLNNQSQNNICIGNIKQKNFRNTIINHLNDLLKDKITKLKLKGLINFQLIGMVVGIPNIGKSSLINFLSQRNDLIVQNKAGVTKKQTIKKINQNFYLIDTPGILVKKIASLHDGYKLAILNNISNKVLPFYDVLKFQYEFLKSNYLNKLNKYFNLDKSLTFDEFLKKIALSHGFIIKNQEIDYDRLMNFLFNLFSKSEICPFHY